MPKEILPSETDGAIINIQLNRWGETLEVIEGQEENYPLEDRDYVLQMIVAIDYVTYNSNSRRFRYTLKPHGEFKLIAVPERGTHG